jgi:methyl-accepting chemotaxis protein
MKKVIKRHSLRLRLSTLSLISSVALVALALGGFYILDDLLLQNRTSYQATQVVDKLQKIEITSHKIYPQALHLMDQKEESRPLENEKMNESLETLTQYLNELDDSLKKTSFNPLFSEEILKSWSDTKEVVKKWQTELPELPNEKIHPSFDASQAALKIFHEKLHNLNKEAITVFKHTNRAASKYNSAKSWFILGVVFFILIYNLLTFLFFTHISKAFSKMTVKLTRHSEHLAQSGHSVEAASQKVSSSTQQQAASIQETVATLNEINAMVENSVENAKKSFESSENSHTIATEGVTIVEQLLAAMTEIEASNQLISEQMEQNSERFTEISTVIQEIAQKTQVINDIVFQTKLLSFNASVEAARAGELGKGFAVVAEEVGNLAQMSGASAQEIGGMLQESIQKVNLIVKDSNSKVESLISGSSERLTKGIEISRQCHTVFKDVLSNVSNVRDSMSEISLASQEQAEGLKNISIAMSQLDEVTNENASVAHDTANYSSELSESSKSLDNVIELLRKEICGGKKEEDIFEEPPEDPEIYLPGEHGSDLVVEKKESELEELSVKESSSKTSTAPEVKRSKPVKKENSSSKNVVDLSSKKEEVKKLEANEKTLEMTGTDDMIPSSEDPRFEDF